MKKDIKEKNIKFIEFFKNLVAPEPVELSPAEEITNSQLSPEDKKQLAKALEEVNKFEKELLYNNINNVKHMEINTQTKKFISKTNKKQEKSVERERE